MNQELGQARAKHPEWQGKNTASVIENFTLSALTGQSHFIKF
jgi:hypothetical protein